MQTNRFRYRIIIGLDDDIALDAFAHAIAEQLTRRFGGCTMYETIGYWAEDGAKDIVYYGEQNTEDGWVIEVVTTKQDDDFVQALVQLASTKIEWDVKGSWIHFEVEQIKLTPFQIL